MLTSISLLCLHHFSIKSAKVESWKLLWNTGLHRLDIWGEYQSTEHTNECRKFNFRHNTTPRVCFFFFFLIKSNPTDWHKGSSPAYPGSTRVQKQWWCSVGLPRVRLDEDCSIFKKQKDLNMGEGGRWKRVWGDKNCNGALGKFKTQSLKENHRTLKSVRNGILGTKTLRCK